MVCTFGPSSCAPPPPPLPPLCRHLGFVHIKKTGGSSWLEHSWHKSDVLPLLLLHGCNDLHHRSAASQRERAGARTWDAAVTLSIVRNPFDWVLSRFLWTLQAECGSVRARWKNTTSMKTRMCSEYADAFTYVGEHSGYALNKPRPYHHSHRALFNSWLANSSYNDSPLMETQSAWLKDANGRLLVRHIVHLEDQYSYLLYGNGHELRRQLCGINGTDYQPMNATQMAHLKSTHSSNRSYYYSAIGCRIVAAAFAEDFRTFGYSASKCL